MEKTRPEAPGLRWNGDARPVWRATKTAVAAGFKPKTLNLARHLNDPAAMVAACHNMQAEMERWMVGNRVFGAQPMRFTGTFASLIDLYESDPESRFQGLSASSRQLYSVYLRMLRANIGAICVEDCTGRDAKIWFNEWRAPAVPGGAPTIAKARTATAVLKAALAFGVMCRFKGCADFKMAMSAVRFEAVAPRTAVVTAEQVTSARAAARAAGHAPAALAYAMQYEGAIRQWDVIGQWVPISDKAPSSVINDRKKWIGPTAANVDANLIYRIKPSKTLHSTGAEVVIDLRVCPMVMEELAAGPGFPSSGPLIVNPTTGRPYSATHFIEVWKSAAEAAGIPAGVWSRDLRASGVTEGRDADVKTDDIKKVVGHSPRSQTTAKVYDRGALEAQRRFATARSERRKKPGAQ